MLLRGSFVHTPELGQLVILKDHLVSVDSDGFITHFESAISSASKSLIDSSDGHILSIPAGSFVLPTFCDLHLHAPQFLYQGNGLDLPLIRWLDRYAFKAEERIDGDPVLARKVYERLAARLIEHGTGAVLLFGTIKEETNLILAQAMQSAGIRAFIGKLSMDISSRPTYVESSAATSLASAESFTQKCAELVRHLPPHRRMVEPVLTPRFVPTCSDELLKGLGKLSEERSLRVQSHMAEAEDLIRWMEAERGMKDTDLFDTVGSLSHDSMEPLVHGALPQSNLLTPRTVQAHCTYLSDSELDHVHDTGTSIAHCPLSNVYFSARPFKLREALRSGVKVGLGTDIAGGYSVDVMSAMRQAIVVSRMRENERVTKGEKHDESLAINWKESLYLATRGGAIALNLPLGTGVFHVGAPFDAQQSKSQKFIGFSFVPRFDDGAVNVYDLDSGSGIAQLDFFDANEAFEIEEDVVEKWWCIGDTRNRSRMWVQGDAVQPSA